MISISLPTSLERDFESVVRESYDGDLQAAITAFLKMHEKYGWKEQLLEDVGAIRREVKRRGGIPANRIEDAVQDYRRSLDG